jgi:diaminopimelate decarboxylase
MAGPLPVKLLPDSATIAPNGHLHIGGCDVVALAEQYGTPLFVYDEDHLRARCREAVATFGSGVAYATKAFLCRAMARLALDEGMHLDVATDGEMHVALAAGASPDRLLMHGNNKSDAELRYAMTVGAKREGVGRIVVDSFDELDRIDAIHADTGAVARVLLRVTPGVDAHTHDFIATGQDDSKFGFTVSSGLAAKAVTRALESSSVELMGIHAHIGSQVFRIASFDDAVAIVADFARPYGLSELSLGGGLGVPYVQGESAPTITEWGATLRAAYDRAGVTARVLAEPGRSIVASAAITVYRVGTIKELPGIRTYVSVDGGMSDNPRPVLYGSGYETFDPANAAADRSRLVTVVGKHCESGDVLVRDASVPAQLAVGDLLATPVTGAYGHSMGSNYQKVRRPAVLFVRNGSARVVVRRETLDDLLRLDEG